MPGPLPTLDVRPGAKPRTLVLCFDGTTNVYDDTNTNVVKLFSLLKRDKRDEQMVYYQPGVGTYAPPGIFLHVTLALAKIADQGVALYLDKHVMGGYEFLMKHYNDGDKICLFGFSRGAYTARALAGMLNKVGLLPPDNIEQIPFAYSMYKRNDRTGFEQSAGFKKTFSREVEIEFMGVWDTVSSVGLLWPRHLPFTASNSIVKTFRHAVSLDEHRAKFKQNVWHVHSANESDASRDPERASPITARPRVASPTQARAPPATALRSAPKSHNLNPADLNINVTAATPPTDDAILPDPPANQAPLWLGDGQTDLRNFVTSAPSSPGAHEENRGGPEDEAWHSREPTRVQRARPDSGVGGLGVEIPATANTGLHTIKSEVSLVAGITSGLGVAASIGVAGEPNEADNKSSTGIMGWLRSFGAKKQSTHMSGTVKFEEDWEENHSEGGKGKEREPDVLEVWFAGCHSDVGGGEELNTEKYSLSNIPLRWMVRQIILSQCGIQFDGNALKDMNMPLPTLSFGKTDPTANYSSAADAAVIKEAQEREERDALAPIHDALRNPLWWPLEFFPLIHSYQDEEGKWHRRYRWNIFRPRHARKTLGVVRVHQSVKYRQEHSDYTPRARLDGTIEYVD